MTRSIGFIGLAGAGKDTAALAMCREFREHGQDVGIVSFASPIHRISRLVGLDPDDRTLKEVPQSMAVDEFCDRFQHAIDTVLGQDLSEHGRVSLYAYTMTALSKRVYQGRAGHCVDISPRVFMQALGTEGGQSVCPTLWIDLAVSRWRGYRDYVLVPDVRYEREAALMDTLYVVVRKGVNAPVNDHPSEALAAHLTAGGSLDISLPVDRLYNGRGLRYFEKKAAHFARKIIRGEVRADG